MIELFYILWNADPEIISGFPPRWYGLLFASGFLVGSSIMTRIYKLDGRNLASGNYIVQVEAAGSVLNQKVTLLK